MIYLDYSATTPVNKEVLDSFIAANNFIGNPNSLHKLGVESKNLIEAATKSIADLLQVKQTEIIYTSGSSESNNLALIGTCLKYQNRGKHIITTRLEHSSINETIHYLESIGYEVSYVKLKNGQVDIQNLKELIRDDTILVSINMVDSELGIRQPIEEIGTFLKKYPKIIFHTDITQALGKTSLNLENVDLASFSAHKIYGLKGVGGLIKKDKIELTPIIHGGKSTTIYRSGTPAVALIVSLAKAIRLILKDFDKNYSYVLDLNKYLKENLQKFDKVVINSTEDSIPNIINFSILTVKPETMLHALEKYEIYISTKSACSKGGPSTSVLEVTNDKESANHSLRISLSHLTTKEEIDDFLKYFDICYQELTNLR